MKLRRGLGFAMVVASAPSHLTAQTTETIDLSGHALETVIPAESDRGQFARIGEIVVSDGSIWVADRDGARVLQFDLDGRLRAEHGRERSGSAELLFTSDMRLDPVTTAVGPDLDRVERFNLDGDHLASAPHEGRPATSLGTLAAPLFHPDGSRLNTVPSYHIETERWPSRLDGIFDPPTGESGAWTSVGDSMAVLVDGVTGMLTRLTVRNGSLVADTFDLSDAESVATRILVGRNDEIWVRTSVAGRHEEWDIVEPGSQRRWHVVFPERFELKAVYDTHLYGILKNELDIPSVVRIADTPR